MKKNQLLLAMFLLFLSTTLFAQKTEVKYYPSKFKAGEIYLNYTYGSYSKGVSSRIYSIDVPKADKFYISTLTNMQLSEVLYIYIDGVMQFKLYPEKDGWQYISVKESNIFLTSGKHEIRFEGLNAMVPMVEEISLSINYPASKENAPLAIKEFLQKNEQLKQQPAFTQASANEVGDFTGKVLPNPYGTYDHAIDTAFAYSHYSTVYLTAGNHTFTTSGSTTNRSLTVFNPTNYTYSWGNVNGGPGGESGLYLIVGLAGYYSVMLRPTVNGTTGTTNIILDGTTLVSNALIGGKTFAMSSLKGGALNFFTCKLSGGDTRMLASRYFSSSARGYNDDYSGGGGDWSWGLASRVKKDFATDSVQYGYVCAYSPTSNGVCDIYLGNQNSDVFNTNYPEFPLLKSDDAIMASPSTAKWYNCIAWSGGLTTTFIWPPSEYSTYNCTSAAGDITCFDNFYSNNPVRYPGAWNYTRTGATVTNSIVDLWKLNASFTHASVRKPGNNHPHGYDWESKPGSTSRTFHPRNALTNTSYGYGAVSNYYIPTGTYASRAANAYESDEDAIKAGVAVFENAQLTKGASEKLNQLLATVDKKATLTFEELYTAWKKTWTLNRIYSDPNMYCQNKEHETLATFCKSTKGSMYLVFDKFLQDDHLIGKIMWQLTNSRYGKLLQEAKNDILNNPNDEQGRFKIHGDHDNGVRYIEKILASIQVSTPQQEVTIEENIKITVSPNPIQDRYTVTVTLLKASKVSIAMVSPQTNQQKILLKETILPAGIHEYKDVLQTAFTGNIIAIQVMVNGTVKTIKTIVAK